MFVFEILLLAGQTVWVIFFFLFVGSTVFALWFGLERMELQKEIRALQRELSDLRPQLAATEKNCQRLAVRVGRLKKWSELADAEEQIEVMRMQAERQLIEAEKHAESLRWKAETELRTYRLEQETRILGDLRELGEEIRRRGKPAMQPAEIDVLCDSFDHHEIGRRLKEVRQNARRAIKKGNAADGIFIDNSTMDESGRFVVDVFNDKFELILLRLKSQPAALLEIEVRDAFGFVNLHCEKFQLTPIASEYLRLKLQELHLASSLHELKALSREEQRRIREQMKEEERARKEYDRVIRETQREEELLRRAIEQATKEVEYSTARERAENERKLAELTQRLQDAESRNQRALSMAQQTKRGHVYVISNVGSFGEDVFKIGLTRRIDPLDRVKELGDSSVPFKFDVHALIFSEDAPALEHMLHRHFIPNQVNKMNPRKEFFRVSLATVRHEIEALGLSASWTMEAEAHDYRETLAIEASMAADPEMKSQWIKHQLEVDEQNILTEAFEEYEEDLEEQSESPVVN